MKQHINAPFSNNSKIKGLPLLQLTPFIYVSLISALWATHLPIADSCPITQPCQPLPPLHVAPPVRFVHWPPFACHTGPFLMNRGPGCGSNGSPEQNISTDPQWGATATETLAGLTQIRCICGKCTGLLSRGQLATTRRQMAKRGL